MKKALILLFALTVIFPLFSDGENLRSSELYTSITTMQSNGYSLMVREGGPIEKNAVTGGGYVLDGEPFVFRDVIPPSKPDGVLAAALDSHTIRLTFPASTDNIRVIGYRIYRDGVWTTDRFTNTASFTDNGLSPITIYHYNVQAVDKSGNLSPMSETVTVATLDPATQNSSPRYVINPFVRYASPTYVVLGFTTDKATAASVDYGLGTSYGSSVTQTDYLTEHTVSIAGLTPGTRYHYRVSVNDVGGHGPVQSQDDTFYTRVGNDTAAPSFSDGPEVGYVSNTSAVIVFATDEDAQASVSYGIGSPGGLQENEPYFDTAHSLTLLNLSPSKTYSYRVSIVDRSGNGPVTSRVKTFKTNPNPDTRGPAILKKPDIAYVTDKLAIITWETDELSDAAVRFGTRNDGPYDRLARSPAMTTHHTVILTNLLPDRKYYFIAWSTDPSDNSSEKSREKLFTTNRMQDRDPPHVRDVEVRAGATSARVSWATEELSDGKLIYGTSPGALNAQVGDGALLDEHTLVLQNLVTGTTYFFQILAKDPSGNMGVSRQYSFRTGADCQGHDGDDGHGGNNGRGGGDDHHDWDNDHHVGNNCKEDGQGEDHHND